MRDHPTLPSMPPARVDLNQTNLARPRLVVQQVIGGRYRDADNQESLQMRPRCYWYDFWATSQRSPCPTVCSISSTRSTGPILTRPRRAIKNRGATSWLIADLKKERGTNGLTFRPKATSFPLSRRQHALARCARRFNEPSYLFFGVVIVWRCPHHRREPSSFCV
jgi:hypothetical protein